MAVEEPGRRVDARAPLGLLAGELQADAGALALGDVADHGVVGDRIRGRMRPRARPDPALDAVEPAQAVGRLGRLAGRAARDRRRAPGGRRGARTRTRRSGRRRPRAAARRACARRPGRDAPRRCGRRASRTRRRTRRPRRARARDAARGRCARSWPRAAPSRRRPRRRCRRRRRRAAGAGRSAPTPSARRRRSRTAGTRARAGAAAARWRNRRARRSARDRPGGSPRAIARRCARPPREPEQRARRGQRDRRDEAIVGIRLAAVHVQAKRVDDCVQSPLGSTLCLTAPWGWLHGVPIGRKRPGTEGFLRGYAHTSRPWTATAAVRGSPRRSAAASDAARSVRRRRSSPARPDAHAPAQPPARESPPPRQRNQILGSERRWRSVASRRAGDRLRRRIARQVAGGIEHRGGRARRVAEGPVEQALPAARAQCAHEVLTRRVRVDQLALQERGDARRRRRGIEPVVRPSSPTRSPGESAAT